ncbi:MAG: hypothetical protein AABX30_02335 [Nanoarchaeota archaeon]
MDKNTIEKIQELAIGGALIAGLLFSGYIAGSQSDDFRNKAKTFKYEEGRSIIRTYQPLKRDQIFIEGQTNSGEYINIKKYLDSIKDARDRKLEEAKIEKLVEW